MAFASPGFGQSADAPPGEEHAETDEPDPAGTASEPGSDQTPAEATAQSGEPEGETEAGEAIEAGEVDEGGVVYDAIDNATVRVFAVRNVRMETVEGRRTSRVIAIPESGHGSGVIVDPRGVIATAKHVVEDMRYIAVKLPGPDGAILPATVAYEDPEEDFALVLVRPSARLPHWVELPAEAPTLTVRSTVDALGYPLDADRDYPQSSRGIISGATSEGHLQLDIAVNPGNSGGPLLAEGRLVGLVVAAGDVRRGVQGIGIAVPVAPVRRAYDAALSDGSLARAQRALRELGPAADQRARVIDGIVRLGDGRLLEEAVDFLNDASTAERLEAFYELAEQAEDPSLLALLAAYFWDGAQIILERAGGLRTPSSLHRGRAKQRATELYELARTLAREAVERDRHIVARSPFVGYLVGGGSTFERDDGGPGSLRSPTWDEPRYRPVLLIGVMVPFGERSDLGETRTGVGFRSSLLLPFLRLDPTDAVRVAPVFGLAFDIFGYDSNFPLHYFVGAELGVMARFGRKGGIALHLAWNPGAYSGPDERELCSIDDTVTGIPTCPRVTVGTAKMLHAALLVKAGRVLFGLSLRAGDDHGDPAVHRYLGLGFVLGGNF